MGVAGVALLYGFISFFKLIAAFFKWMSWKSNGVLYPAVPVAVLDTEDNYKNKKGLTHYRYNVAVDYRDRQPMTVYPMAVLEKTVPTNSCDTIAIGKELKLYYNPKTKALADPAELKSAVMGNLGALVACIVVFFLCMLIAEAIG